MLTVDEYKVQSFETEALCCVLLLKHSITHYTQFWLKLKEQESLAENVNVFIDSMYTVLIFRYEDYFMVKPLAMPTARLIWPII
jgi:hypothetical protein